MTAQHRGRRRGILRRGPLSLLLVLGLPAGISACDGSGSGGFPPELKSPEARDKAAVAGAELYRQGGCPLCHGENADGKGPRRAALSAPPADFTYPGWRESITPREIFHIIQKGRPGTSMPAWSHLSDRETWQVVAYLDSVSRGKEEQ